MFKNTFPLDYLGLTEYNSLSTHMLEHINSEPIGTWSEFLKQLSPEVSFVSFWIHILQGENLLKKMNSMKSYFSSEAHSELPFTVDKSNGSCD